MIRDDLWLAVTTKRDEIDRREPPLGNPLEALAALSVVFARLRRAIAEQDALDMRRQYIAHMAVCWRALRDQDLATEADAVRQDDAHCGGL